MNRIIIIGAGGHGRVAADIASLCGFDVAFLDDSEILLPGIIKFGKVADYKKYLEYPIFVAIGNNTLRRNILRDVIASGGKPETLVHPNAVCSSGAQLGKGCIVMAGAVISTGTVIGDGVIVNTCSSIDHDCLIGDYCHISVGAHLAGSVHIGNSTMIGAGATVVNNISITADSMVAAGAVVVKNITERGTYMGIPAKNGSAKNFAGGG